jgi:hypothetical protein
MLQPAGRASATLYDSLLLKNRSDYAASPLHDDGAILPTARTLLRHLNERSGARAAAGFFAALPLTPRLRNFDATARAQNGNSGRSCLVQKLRHLLDDRLTLRPWAD